MIPSLFPLACLWFAVFGQTVFGKVEKIDHDQLQIRTPDGLVTLYIDARTTVRKGDVRNDVSALAIGDEIRATCYGEQKITAVNISAYSSPEDRP